MLLPTFFDGCSLWGVLFLCFSQLSLMGARYPVMRHFAIAVFIGYFFTNSYGQVESFRKNTLSFETGIFSRGLMGISYSRGFLKFESGYLSADFYGGFGHPGYRHYYFGAGPNINFGRERFFFLTGFDLSYYRLTFANFSSAEHHYYKRLTVSPHVGLRFLTSAGFSTGFKAGVLPVIENGLLQMPLPQIGFSFGYTF